MGAGQITTTNHGPGYVATSGNQNVKRIAGGCYSKEPGMPTAAAPTNVTRPSYQIR